jgi:hypothetical protein
MNVGDSWMQFAEILSDQWQRPIEFGFRFIVSPAKNEHTGELFN